MLCSNCSKLAYQHLNKTCLRCQGPVFKSIAAICDNCSTRNKQCAACLKKIDNSSFKKNAYRGCGACGK